MSFPWGGDRSVVSSEPHPHFLGGRIEGSATGLEIFTQNRLPPSFPPQHQSCNPRACTGHPHASVPHLSLLKSLQDLEKNYLQDRYGGLSGWKQGGCLVLQRTPLVPEGPSLMSALHRCRLQEEWDNPHLVWICTGSR